MKLPRVQYRAVESLGRSDSGAVAQAAHVAGQTGALQQQMGNVIAKVADQYVERKQNAEYNDQVASMQTEMNDWQGQYSAKDFFTSDELGEIGKDLVPRTETSVDAQGTVTTKVRDDIPAHEVYPHMLKQKLEAITKDKAAKISNPHMRKEFLNKASVSNSQMVMQAAINAENQQELFMLEEGVYNAETAAEGGHLDEALFYIENLETDETTKKELIAKAFTADEMFDVTQASRSNDHDVVSSMWSMLTDPNYDGYLSEGQRAAAINDLSRQLDVLGLEGVQDRQTQQNIRDNNRLYSAGLGNMTHEEVEAGYELWEVDPKHPDAISVDRRLQLHGAIDAYDSAVLTEERRVQSEMEKAETKAQKAETKAQKAAYDKYYSDLNRGLDTGEIDTHGKIESIYEMGQEMALEGQSGGLKPADRTTMHRRLDTLNKERSKVANYQTYISGALSGKYPLRATNPDHVKAVEWYVEELGLTRDNVEDLGVLTKLTGIMPDNLRDNIEGGLLSGNPEQGVNAMRYIQNLQDSGSHLTSKLSQDTMDIANYANMLVRGGEDPAAALGKANKAYTEVTHEMRVYYKQAYKDAKPDNVKALSDLLDADPTFDFEWGWNKDIIVPPAMQGQFNAMVQASFPFAQGDHALAVKLAYKNTMAQWGVTGAGIGPLGKTGPRASMHAPEKILQRSTNDVNLGLTAWAESEGIDSENLVLVHDNGTLRDRSWTVWVMDPDTGDSDIYPERWAADDWVAGAVGVDDKARMIDAHENMVQRGNDLLQSTKQLNEDRISGRDLQ